MQRTDQDQMPPSLQRPRTLGRAAASLARHYRRDRDLAAILPQASAVRPAALSGWLAEREAALEAARRRRAPDYRPMAHVQVLAALLGEGARPA